MNMCAIANVVLLVMSLSYATMASTLLDKIKDDPDLSQVSHTVFNAPIFFFFYLSILTSALWFHTTTKKHQNVWNFWVVRASHSLSLPSITSHRMTHFECWFLNSIVTFWRACYFSSLTKCERCDCSEFVTEFVCLYKILLITYFINDFKWQHNRLRYGCENCVRISTDTQFFFILSSFWHG